MGVKEDTLGIKEIGSCFFGRQNTIRDCLYSFGVCKHNHYEPCFSDLVIYVEDKYHSYYVRYSFQIRFIKKKLTIPFIIGLFEHLKDGNAYSEKTAIIPNLMGIQVDSRDHCFDYYQEVNKKEV